MNAFTDSLTTLAGRISSDLLIWSCQAFVLLLCVGLVLKLCRTTSPALRHQVWLFGLVAMLALPLWTSGAKRIPALRPVGSTLSYIIEAPGPVTFSLRHPASEGAASYDQADLSYVGSPRIVGGSLILPLLFAGWAMGVLIISTRFVRADRKLRRALKRSCPVRAAELGCAEFEALATGKVGLRLSSEIQSPVLRGLLRATVLLPADITQWTTPDERNAMLQHELAHVERRDALVNLFQSALGIVFFFHPLVRYACRQLSLEREMACDEHVLERGASAEAYAEGILKVAERSILVATPVGVHQLALFSAREVLERRIEMILNRDRVRMIARKWRYLIVPAGLIVLVGWLLIPVGTAKSGLAGQQSESDAGKSKSSYVVVTNKGGTGYEADASEYKLMLVRRMGDNKAFEDLIHMALQNADPELRRLAAVRLTELEGDGSTGAMTQLYDKSDDPVVKRMMIDTLARNSEIEPLAKIALNERSAEYRERALQRIKWLKETSDSEDIKAWDVSSLQEEMSRLPELPSPPPPPPPPPPPLTIPLPAEVTGLRRVAFLEADGHEVSLGSPETKAAADGSIRDVTVSIPGFKFKAARAYRGEGWVYLVDRFEFEHDGQKYYGAGSMLIRTIPGGMVSDVNDTSIECWLSSSGAIYKSPTREGEQVSFSDLLPN